MLKGRYFFLFAFWRPQNQRPGEKRIGSENVFSFDEQERRRQSVNNTGRDTLRKGEEGKVSRAIRITTTRNLIVIVIHLAGESGIRLRQD